MTIKTFSSGVFVLAMFALPHDALAQGYNFGGVVLVTGQAAPNPWASMSSAVLWQAPLAGVAGADVTIQKYDSSAMEWEFFSSPNNVTGNAQIDSYTVSGGFGKPGVGTYRVSVQFYDDNGNDVGSPQYSNSFTVTVP
jgi:hypothetical protein